MSKEFKTYRANAEGFDGDRIRLEGDVFTTSIPKGSWMTELDEDGNEIEEPDHAPEFDEEDADLEGDVDVVSAAAAEKLKKAIAAKDDEIAELKKKLPAKGNAAPAKPAAAKPAAGKPAATAKGAGKAATTPPAAGDEKRNLLEGLTDEELRKFVADKTKAEPAADATRDQLLEAAIAD